MYSLLQYHSSMMIYPHVGLHSTVSLIPSFFLILLLTLEQVRIRFLSFPFLSFLSFSFSHYFLPFFSSSISLHLSLFLSIPFSISLFYLLISWFIFLPGFSTIVVLLPVRFCLFLLQLFYFFS